MNTEKSFVVGLTGGSGAGKTRIVGGLKERIHPEKLTVITQDNYYRDRDKQPLDERGIRNFDTLQSIDFQRMESDIFQLMQGKSIRQKVYTFNNELIPEEWTEIEPAPLLLIEGVFAFANASIFHMLDLSVYIDLPRQERLNRRIRRDNLERGYDIDDVKYRFRNHVMPAHEKHIQPYREKADLVIDNSGNVEASIDRLYRRIIEEIDFSIE